MRVGISILVVAFSGRSDCTDSLPRRYTIECLLAGYSKLSLYDGYFPRSRVPYNLCRNHEWLACAAQGKLPGMDGALTSSKSIIFVSSPLEVLTRNNEWLDQCSGWWGAPQSRTLLNTAHVVLTYLCTCTQSCSHL